MTTFEVASVPKESIPVKRANREEALTHLLGGVKPESQYTPSHGGVPVSSGRIHSVIGAVHMAFALHHPLSLSPDHIWMCIAQGLASHVNANADKLRNKFVQHEGKETLIVQRDDFVKGKADNPWPEVFDAFSEQIRTYVGPETHDLLTPDFTTTGPNEKAAAQVVLMDTLKNYFSYEVHTRCGIPEITLEGTVDDWKKLRAKALSLARYDLDWWIESLKPILDQFVDAASGKVDKQFWCDIYKRNNRSGGPYVTGWIITLFPYLTRGKNPYLKEWNKEMMFGGVTTSSFPCRIVFTLFKWMFLALFSYLTRGKNPYLKEWNKEMVFGGVTTSSFPRGIVYTPFKWMYLGSEIPMHFYAGFMSVTQDPQTLTIRPEIGWAIA